MMTPDGGGGGGVCGRRRAGDEARDDIITRTSQRRRTQPGAPTGGVDPPWFPWGHALRGTGGVSASSWRGLVF
ncbi:unnamed protein product [Merluccius merluccius]